MQSDFADRPAFETIRPRRQTAPFVFNSAHSGTDYPERFLKMTRLDRFSIRQSEDTFVDEIFERAPYLGVPLLRARFPRAYLDVNREPYELDPQMFCDPLPAHHNTASKRVAAGLGTLAKIVAENKSIYREKLTLSDAMMRIQGIYKPYHSTLQNLLSQTLSRFGVAVLIDCHSMPPLNDTKNSRAPQIILGDRFGTTCSPALIDMAEDLFVGLGFIVARNKPYAGGFITRSYGTPKHGIHALQIEFSRHLYMNESTRRANKNFNLIKEVATKLIERFIQMDFDLVSQNQKLYPSDTQSIAAE
ncbi:MAG: N-formylglutamate amidohydrolase [Devosiaceae bacterium]|nr:N-formylglutamate amidohydrolase [Devosiaceae bacterium]